MIKNLFLFTLLLTLFIQTSYSSEYFCNGLKATIVGTDGDDHLIGTPGDDVIVALGGNDKVEGGEGNDTICGNSGVNKLMGGPGNDTIIGGSGWDSIFGGEGDDYIDGGEGNNIGCYNAQCGLNGGPGNDEIHGGDGVDLINGDDGDDKLYGHGGGNRINGGEGNDYIENGDDGNSSDRSCVGGSCGLYGGPGDDEIHGGLGMDHLIGGPGNDKLYGTANLNKLEGGPGDDILYMGENGTSSCPISRTCGLFGGEGNDQLFGSKEKDFLSGGPGNDVLRGGDEWDILDGGPGDDELYGENGDDELFGGPGADLCVGGAGNDICKGEEPYTETIAEDDDLCHEDVEEKNSCRGPGQPEFYELTFDHTMTAPETVVKMNGSFTYKYSKSLGFYEVIDGLMNLKMNAGGCVDITGTYKPRDFKKTRMLVESLDKYGRNLKLSIFGQIMTNVIQSRMTDSCSGQTMRNIPPTMVGPTLSNYKTKMHIILNQKSLNVINHNENGSVDEADLDTTITLKGKGILFPLVPVN
jgi:hypothetical protein